jgi:protein-disulfide isomerase
VRATHKLMDRLLTVLVIAAIPVLGVSLWRMGATGVDTISKYQQQQARKALVDSLWASGASRIVIGHGEGERTYIEIVDYQCPYCRVADSLLQQTIVRRSGVRIIALQFPLTSIHPFAERAAVAAVCADRQGIFAPFHHALYSQKMPETPQELWKAARASGGRDSTSFAACLGDPTALFEVQREARFAKRLNVLGTPTFIDREGNQVPLEQVARGEGAR